MSVRELHESFTPGLAEIEWARELTRSPEHCLALVMWLKSLTLGTFALARLVASWYSHGYAAPPGAGSAAA
ncbi:MAG: hypothetical protein WBF75_12610 [Pseudonocardiaceae bacterium]